MNQLPTMFATNSQWNKSLAKSLAFLKAVFIIILDQLRIVHRKEWKSNGAYLLRLPFETDSK